MEKARGGSDARNLERVQIDLNVSIRESKLLSYRNGRQAARSSRSRWRCGGAIQSGRSARPQCLAVHRSVWCVSRCCSGEFFLVVWLLLSGTYAFVSLSWVSTNGALERAQRNITGKMQPRIYWILISTAVILAGCNAATEVSNQRFSPSSSLSRSPRPPILRSPFDPLSLYRAPVRKLVRTCVHGQIEAHVRQTFERTQARATRSSIARGAFFERPYVWQSYFASLRIA